MFEFVSLVDVGIQVHPNTWSWGILQSMLYLLNKKYKLMKPFKVPLSCVCMSQYATSFILRFKNVTECVINPLMHMGVQSEKYS